MFNCRVNPITAAETSLKSLLKRYIFENFEIPNPYLGKILAIFNRRVNPVAPLAVSPKSFLISYS